MKYVRTKDGKIYDSLALRVDEIVYKDEQGKWCREYRTVDPLKKVLKTADTIEELCDELVFDNVYHSRMTPSAMHTKENQEVIKSYLKQNIVCYGAIWTDKGLIFVAKMNNKGVLELL